MPTRNGFSKDQRNWIVRRDGNKCVLCGSTRGLHVHHVQPFRWCVTVLGWTIERTNLPTNGATVCEQCHNGTKAFDYASAIHPDVEYARLLYATDRLSYAKMFAKRDECCRNAQPYWNTTHDNRLALIATRNTMAHLLGSPDDVPTMWEDGEGGGE